MKYIFIVNPNAGKGKCKELLPKIEKECKKRNREYEIREISEEKSGFDIALEYKDQDNILYEIYHLLSRENAIFTFNLNIKKAFIFFFNPLTFWKTSVII